MSTSRRSGFTLLEVIIAIAILGMAMVAIASVNSTAVYSHVYAKKLTVATLLARSKMIDLEQQLIDKPMPLDDDEDAGDFSDEGWPSYKWRAKIIAPRTQGLSPEQLIGALFNIPLPSGDGKSGGGAGGLASLFTGGGAGAAAGGLPGGLGGLAGALPGGLGALGGLAGAGAAGAAGGAGAGGGIFAALGPAGALMQGQFTTLVDQLTKSVREVHLTVSWKEGKLTESFDLVTHVVSLGPGSDRNGGAAAAAAAAAGGTAPPSGEQWVRVTDGQVVPNPVPAPNGAGMVEPGTNTQLMPLSQWQAQRGNGNSPVIPGLPGVNPALLDRSGNPRLLPSGLGTVR